MIDQARGAMLLGIFLLHLEGVLAPLAFQPLGLVSYVEFFLIFSGFVAAYLYKPHNSGVKILRRARKIYVFHISSVLAVMLIALVFPLAFDTIWIENDPSWRLLTDTPLKAVTMAATLLYQPKYLEILPIYVWMTLLSYPVLTYMNNKPKQAFVLVPVFSFSVWLLGQFVGDVFILLQNNVLPSGSNLGVFMPHLWQVYYVAGLWLSFYMFKEKRLSFTPPPCLVIGAALVLFLIAKITHFLPTDATPAPLLWLEEHANKRSVGWLRLVNVGVLFYIGYWLSTVRPQWLELPFLNWLSRHALVVFTLQAPLVYGGIMLREYYLAPYASSLTQYGTDIVLTCVLVLILIAVAYQQERPYKATKKRQG